MVDGYRYRDYLEQRKQAALTANLINGIGAPKRPIQVGDICGYWADGRVMDKMQYYQYLKRKAKRGR